MIDDYEMGGYYIEDSNGQTVPVGLLKWAKMFEETDRTVKKTNIGRYLVSPVFLGSDHRFFGDGPPLLYETMVFADNSYADLVMERYSTRAEAESGHERMVEQVQSWPE